MHPDEDLVKKRLGEKFASYEPEPNTRWGQIQEKLPLQPIPSRRWRVGIGIFGLLLLGLLGYWVSDRMDAPLATQARVSVPALSAKRAQSPSDPVPIGDHSLMTRRLTKLHSTPQLTLVPTDQQTGVASIRYKKGMSDARSVGITSPLSQAKRPPSALASQPLVTTHRLLAVKPASSRASVRRHRIGSSVVEQTPWAAHSALASSEKLVSWLGRIEVSSEPVVNRPLIKLEPLAIRSLVYSPTKWPFRQLTVPTLKRAPQWLSRHEPRLSWVIKGGPLLGYRVIQAQQRENTSARNLQNLNSSLSGRLGWQLYLGQQRLLSRGRQWEVGMVYRQFRQGIEYQLPNGQYLLAVQPNQSATVTQLRDTLTDQTIVRQTGLRLGYRVPLLGPGTSRLYWGIGGELVHQFSLNRALLNAELTLGGSTLAKPGRPPVLVELFANTALQSVYDKNGWVSVLPYQVGLRVGVLLMPVR